MNTKPLETSFTFAISGLFILSLILSACATPPVQVAATPLPSPIPTLTLDETSMKEFIIQDFDAVHAPVGTDQNKYLIFGNLAVSKPPAGLPPELAVFLGRWEGYSYSPPVKKDRKLVLVIPEITTREGRFYAWSATNLQYPDAVGDAHFRVVQGQTPSIELQVVWPDDSKEIVSFTYDREKDLLRGWSNFPATHVTAGPYELTRAKSFNVYKDYPAYLASQRIYPREYKNKALEQYGKGYMLYLPEGYETAPNKSWPLLFFLHGIGDRGDNLFVLPKASPFMMIREKGPLPYIIVAPLLDINHAYFPDEYMTGALNEVMAEYRVDEKRIYLTGMSLGGEAAYRFALHQPAIFAAMAVLCAYLDDSVDTTIGDVKDLPVWALHGADDQVIPLPVGQRAANILKKAGANVRFSILEGHDHDIWTDTYSDPQFYDWFMQYKKP